MKYTARCLALFAAACVGWSAASAQEKLSIPSRTPTSLTEYLHGQGATVTVTGYLYLPAGAGGPLPIMILKHGSGGLSGPNGDNLRAWARTLNEWGVAAVLVDSFGPRGIGDSATDQGKLRSLADLADSFAAVKVLQADPRFDPGRIGIMGWSRGGAVAMEAALESARLGVLAPTDAKFAAHVVFYGSAEPQYRDTATNRAPMLFLHGEADNLVPVAPTREFADWIRAQGNAVTFQTYPGVYHDFDVVGGYDGSYGMIENARNCDVVVDFSSGKVVRMAGKPVDGVSGLALISYMHGCMQRGAELHPNAAARADAVQRVHGFLQQAFHLAG
ncbi:MAG TPA: dienelactone hydrolase family protein [Burkholderiaceae bacterium]|nr:dienelactone hydrolase family protein [Burkholderiaceae bacterium]